jgi:hypothetical protein
VCTQDYCGIGKTASPSTVELRRSTGLEMRYLGGLGCPVPPPAVAASGARASLGASGRSVWTCGRTNGLDRVSAPLFYFFGGVVVLLGGVDVVFGGVAVLVGEVLLGGVVVVTEEAVGATGGCVAVGGGATGAVTFVVGGEETASTTTCAK